MTQTQGVVAEEVGAAAATVVAGNSGSFHSAAPLPAPPGLAAAPLRSPATRRGPTLECRRSSLATLTQQLQLEVEEVVVEAGAGAATEVAGSFGLFSRLPRLALAFLRSRATHRGPMMGYGRNSLATLAQKQGVEAATLAMLAPLRGAEVVTAMLTLAALARPAAFPHSLLLLG